MKWLLLISILYSGYATAIMGLHKIQLNEYDLIVNQVNESVGNAIRVTKHAIGTSKQFEKKFNNCVVENSARIRRAK